MEEWERYLPWNWFSGNSQEETLVSEGLEKKKEKLKGLRRVEGPPSDEEQRNQRIQEIVAAGELALRQANAAMDQAIAAEENINKVEVAVGNFAERGKALQEVDDSIKKMEKVLKSAEEHDNNPNRASS